MKQFEIYFDWGELLVEVAAETFHRGKVIENGENYRLLHELMATEDNKVHVEKLWGSATKAFGELGRAVGEYVRGSSTTTGSHTPGFEASDMILELEMPNNWNSGLGNSLAEGAHAYMRNRMLAEWYAVTEPEMVRVYAELAAASLREVVMAVHSRVRPVRPVRG